MGFDQTWAKLREGVEATRRAKSAARAAGAPGFSAFSLRKKSHNAWVFEATLEDGCTAFLKHYVGPQGPKRAAATVAEVTRVRVHMPSGKTVAAVLWSAPEAGLVLSEAAPGKAISETLRARPKTAFGPQVGAWLHAYLGPSLVSGTFSARFWVKKRQNEDLSGLAASDRRLIEQALALQEARIDALEHQSVLKGDGPGDFAPHNLFAQGHRMTGIDVETSAHVPVARAVARFAVLADPLLAPGPRWLGLNEGMLRGLANAGPKRPDPPELLPFLVTDELIARLVKRHDAKAGPGLRRALDAHLSSL